MSTENHLGLPEEVFELILHRLDVPDLLSCCLVCSGWRNAVNSNPLWERLCRRNIHQDRLKKDVSVYPLRLWQEQSKFESSLFKLCPWRLRFAEDVQLKMNWKYGIFWEDEVFLQCQTPMHTLETDYDVILQPFLRKPSFAVYDLLADPVVTDVIDYALYQAIPESFKLVNNVAVVVQCTLLQVFVKDDDNNFVLRLVALFDKDEVHSRTIPADSNLQDWYISNGGCYPCDISVRCDHNGSYFVGIYCTDTDFSTSALHIWDLRSRTKAVAVALPEIESCERVFDVSVSLFKNVVHVILDLTSPRYGTTFNAIHSYDIETREYRQIHFQVDYAIPLILFTDELLITTNFEMDTIHFNHLKTQTVAPPSIETSSTIDCRTIQVFDNLLAYTEFSSCTKVTVHDVNDHRVVDHFQVPGAGSTYGAYSLHIFFKDLMLVGLSMEVHLRDIKKGELIRVFELLNFISPNPACTQMLVEKPDGQIFRFNIENSTRR